MSLRRVGRVWWIDFYTRDGKRIRQSAQTENKSLAQELHDKLKAEAWRIGTLGEKTRRTWEEAVVRWLKEQDQKATIEMDRIHLRWADKLLRRKKLDEIRRDTLDKLSEVRKAQGVSNATVNRMLEVVRAILRRAANEWEWLDKAPQVRMLAEPKRRIRFLARDEAARLIQELPEHLGEMAAFTLATGLRRNNVTGLQWSQVDLQRRLAWIHADEAKARKAIGVPLNAEAMGILEGRVGKHATHVFSYRGKPIRQVSTKGWYKALERAGIQNFRWHDLRHTWASWHIQGGTPALALQELGGWESAEMVRRYAHLSSEHLAHYADRHVLGIAGKRKGIANATP
jgi:integrase